MGKENGTRLTKKLKRKDVYNLKTCSICVLLNKTRSLNYMFSLQLKQLFLTQWLKRSLSRQIMYCRFKILTKRKERLVVEGSRE